MSLTPIEYHPWKGVRSEHGRRPLVIASKVFRQRLASKWFIALLVLGSILSHGLNLLLFSIMPHTTLTPELMVSQMKGGGFYLFTVILVAMACSDLIAEDLRSNSLVLYLSRAIRTDGYLLGKVLGVGAVLAIFTLLLPVMVAVAITATQSSGDYASSLAVVGRTILAGVWTVVFLVPLAMLVSALTSRRTYAAVGTFMLFFVLGLISDFLSRFDDGWIMIGPQAILGHGYEAIYGVPLTTSVDPVLVAVASAVFVIPPLLLVYYIIHRREVGA